MRITAAALAIACAILGAYVVLIVVETISAHAADAAGARFATAFAVVGMMLPVGAEVLWRRRRFLSSVIVWGAALVALAVSAGMTADALAARRSAEGDALSVALRAREADVTALQTLRAERAAMRFNPAGPEDVEAADRAIASAKAAAERIDAALTAAMADVAAADAAAQAEGERGGCKSACKAWQAQAAAGRAAATRARVDSAAAWAVVTEADTRAADVRKAATATAAARDLDAQIKEKDEALKAAPAIADPLAQGKLLALALDHPEADAAKLQDWFRIASSLSMEVIGFSAFLAAIALLGIATTGATAPRPRVRFSGLIRAIRPAAASRNDQDSCVTEPARPATPRLVVSNPAPIDPSDVASILAPLLVKSARSKIDLAAAGQAYAAACEARGAAPLPPAEAARPIAEACRARGFTLHQEGERFIIKGARLRA